MRKTNAILLLLFLSTLLVVSFLIFKRSKSGSLLDDGQLFTNVVFIKDKAISQSYDKSIWVSNKDQTNWTKSSSNPKALLFSFSTDDDDKIWGLSDLDSKKSLWYSGDGGDSWSQIDNPQNTTISQLFSTNDGSVIIVSTNGEIWVLNQSNWIKIFSDQLQERISSAMKLGDTYILVSERNIYTRDQSDEKWRQSTLLEPNTSDSLSDITHNGEKCFVTTLYGSVFESNCTENNWNSMVEIKDIWQAHSIVATNEKIYVAGSKKKANTAYIPIIDITSKEISQLPGLKGKQVISIEKKDENEIWATANGIFFESQGKWQSVFNLIRSDSQ